MFVVPQRGSHLTPAFTAMSGRVITMDDAAHTGRRHPVIHHPVEVQPDLGRDKLDV